MLIRRGDRSAAVEDLQSRLLRLGFEIDASELGGTFGRATEMAVRAFQQKRGIVADGVVGPDSWRELVEASWALGDRVIKLREPHMRGDDIRDLQARLNALGFAAGKHDGIFGHKTTAALRDFQRDMVIEEDGIAGEMTVAALERLRLVTRGGLGPRTREKERRRSASPGVVGKRIVLDPGHGGDDAGAKGPSGETEAEAVFHIAARVGEMLEELGAVTTLTRGPHNGPDESTRARLANEFEADLLISLHLNSHPSERASGAASYYFAHEGIASEPGEHLAELIQQSLASAGRLDCRAHGQAYPILRETRMPAVLLEPAFITNPEEAKLVWEKPGLDVIASAIAEAVRSYFSVEI